MVNHLSSKTIQNNLAIARRFMDELWNQRRLELADELFAEDFVTDTLSHYTVPWQGKGPDSIKRHIREHWLTPVPDLHFVAHEMVADVDRVVTQWSATGTHQGTLFGIPPTGKSFTLLGMTISQIQNGKIVHSTTILDTLGFLQQLGLLPDNPTIVRSYGNWAIVNPESASSGE